MTARSARRRRFYVEAGLSTAGLALLVLTLISQEWIEVLFGVDPDHGDGSFEWLVVAVLAIVTVASAVSARIEWRRPPAAESPTR
jgi:hypothetical protein